MSVSAGRRRPLAGRLVLLVEDEAAARSNTEAVLRGAGASVLLAHGAYQATLVASRHTLAAAVLDARLGHQTIDGIGAYLEEHAVPFVLITDWREKPARGHWQHVPRLRKPADARELAIALARVIDRARDERRRRRL